MKTPVKQQLNQHPALKRLIHWLLVKPGQAQPRFLTLWVINRLFHRVKGKISFSVRQDLFPFQDFSLGKGSKVESFTTLNNGVGEIHIGYKSRVGIGNVIIGPVKIGDRCLLAQNVVISGLNHYYENVSLPIAEQGVETKLVELEDNCWIGANATVLPGVKIGYHSVVAAGSVVTRNVPAFSVVAGNPAKVIKRYNPETNRWENEKEKPKEAQKAKAVGIPKASTSTSPAFSFREADRNSSFQYLANGYADL